MFRDSVLESKEEFNYDNDDRNEQSYFNVFNKNVNKTLIVCIKSCIISLLFTLL